MEIHKMKDDLDKKYPASIPVSRDSIIKTFIKNIPPKINDFYYIEHTASGTIYSTSRQEFFTTREYSNVLDMYENDETYDKYIGIEVTISDFGNQTQWERATNWYCILHELPSPNLKSTLISPKLRPYKSKIIVDSKGRTWVETRTPGKLNELNASIDYQTLINNRYSVYILAQIRNIDRPEFKKYYNVPIVGPEFSIKLLI